MDAALDNTCQPCYLWTDYSPDDVLFEPKHLVQIQTSYKDC
jgi:hypothetical protein